jgi:hypothetical protein
MENILLLPETENLAGQKIRSRMTSVFHLRERELVNSFVDYLISEGGETFFHYLNGLGHAYKSNMMLISARHNYYYDFSDLKGVSTVINLKRLNRVSHLNSFLNTISRTIAPGTCFAGCFTDRTSQTTGNNSNHGKRMNGINANRVHEIEISSEEVMSLLESCQLTVYDMTEIKGLTYFLARK